MVIILCLFYITNGNTLTIASFMESSKTNVLRNEVSKYSLKNFQNISKITVKEFPLKATTLESVDFFCSSPEMLETDIIITDKYEQNNILKSTLDVLSGFLSIPVIATQSRNTYFNKKKLRLPLIQLNSPYFYQANVYHDFAIHFKWKYIIFVHTDDFESYQLYEQLISIETKQKHIVIEKVIKLPLNLANYTELLRGITTCFSRIIFLSSNSRDSTNIFSSARRLGLLDTQYIWILNEEVINGSNVPIGMLGVQYENRNNFSTEVGEVLRMITTSYESMGFNQNKRNCSSPVNNRETMFKFETLIKYSSSFINFDAFGNQEKYFFNVMNVQPDGLAQVGSISRNNNATDVNLFFPNIIWPNINIFPFNSIKESYKLKVTILDQVPYIKTFIPVDGKCEPPALPCPWTDPANNKTTPYCCKGFCVGLLNKLAYDLNLQFELHIVGDKKYGPYYIESDKNLFGIIKELAVGKADIGAIGLHITRLRMKYIDFTFPFILNRNRILLYKNSNNVFSSFFQSFSLGMWVVLFACPLIVATALYLFDRVSPFSRYFMARKTLRKFPRSKREMSNALSMSSAIWFALGVLLNIPIAKRVPRSFSGKLLGMMWAIFSFLIVASYTANLASFYVKSISGKTITTVEDLIIKKNIDPNFTLSTVGFGFTPYYFKYHKTLIHVFTYMNKIPYNSTQSAIKDMEEGKLSALIDLESQLKYWVAGKCSFSIVGSGFGEVEVAFGIRKNLPVASQLSNQIQNYVYDGTIQYLEMKHIEQDSICAQTTKFETVGVENMTELVIIVSVGILGGLAIFMLEILYNKRKISQKKSLKSMKAS